MVEHMWEETDRHGMGGYGTCVWQHMLICSTASHMYVHGNSNMECMAEARQHMSSGIASVAYHNLAGALLI